MVVTAPLTGIGYEALTPPFNTAFADYDLPLSLSPSELKAHLDGIDYSGEDSVGLFDQGALVGFLFVGRRGAAAYDGGTAIIPAYRGKGHAHTLIEAAATHLKARGCTTFTLEVLHTNARAKSLYTTHGFVEKRTLACYERSLPLETTSPSLEMRIEESPFAAVNRWAPSWQNQNRSVEQAGYLHGSYRTGGVSIGSVAFHPVRGSIAQIVLNDDHNTVTTLKEAIVACTKRMEAKAVRIINVDENDRLLNAALIELGFHCFARQSEMVRTL
ncbi:MAG TPA: GNAT family N-acetyltransferase [Sphaerochaeta sp.]|mgnify:CR=1 FL=1|jgi:GNAT superfamily N-acetyltransferase|nr:GNAT family N-acetyltransferase [Sphaerochaeta sp.]